MKVKLFEVVQSNFGVKTLSDSDTFVVEMANFLADVTELPANIVLWTKDQPDELPHTKYRMKVYKDRVHSTTFSIGQVPEKKWEVGNKKYRLDSNEEREVTDVISRFSSLFIQYVDGKMSANDVKYEIKRLNG